MRCCSCGGVAHPATGHVYSPTMIACGPCIRAFWSWMRGWTNQGRRVKGTRDVVYFYERATV